MILSAVLYPSVLVVMTYPFFYVVLELYEWVHWKGWRCSAPFIFFLVPTIQQNCYLLDVKKSRWKPLSFVKYIITNPYPTLIPRQPGKCHLPSPIYCVSLSHLWGKEEGTSSWDWITHLSPMGTKWQRQCQMTNVLECGFSFYYVTLTDPLTTEWSKL